MATLFWLTPTAGTTATTATATNICSPYTSSYTDQCWLGGTGTNSTTAITSTNSTSVYEAYLSQVQAAQLAMAQTSTTTQAMQTMQIIVPLLSPGSCYNNVYNPAVNEYVVDEEEYLNNSEYYELARQRGVAFRVRSAEEKRLAQEAQARQAEELKERYARREAINQRARELLVSCLTLAQRESLEKHAWFLVIGGNSGKRYRIRTNSVMGNIDVMAGKRSDRVEARLCCHCQGNIPESDQHLAQKLALEYDEARFLSIANRQAA
jgi:hypothetical protein